MATKNSNSKRLQIDKANASMVIVTAVSSFIVVFSLVASKALLSQRSYQSRVIAKKEQARDQLKENIDNAKTLNSSYKAFVDTTQNVLGGNPAGQGDRDGNNAQIVLDALPSTYDFPAVASSLEKLLGGTGVNLQSMTGTDDEVGQQSVKASANPAPVAIPFEASISGSYGAVQGIIRIFEASIRPFTINKISFSGSDSNLTASISSETYYQPATSLDIKTEVIK